MRSGSQGARWVSLSLTPTNTHAGTCAGMHTHTHTRAHVLQPLSSFQSPARPQNMVTSSSPFQTFSSSDGGEGDSGKTEGEGPVRASANCTQCCPP